MMVDYIIEMGDRFKQRNQTIHLASEYADQLVQSGVFSESELLEPKENDAPKPLYLWAIACLMVASKFDDHDPNIPFYKEYIRSSRRAIFKQQEFLDAEARVLKDILEWDLN